VYLDRHNLACSENQVMKNFRLQRNYKGKYRYAYVCCDLPVDCQRHDKKATSSNSDGNGNMVYLDRHTLQCNNNFIDAFKLNRDGSTKIKYNFDCCVIPDKKSCYQGTTKFDLDGGGNTVYLDRQNVACRRNYGLTYFKLNRNSAHNRIQYKFECCTIKEVIPSKFL
jgi:hypothetical protein